MDPVLLNTILTGVGALVGWYIRHKKMGPFIPADPTPVTPTPNGPAPVVPAPSGSPGPLVSLLSQLAQALLAKRIAGQQLTGAELAAVEAVKPHLSDPTITPK